MLLTKDELKDLGTRAFWTFIQTLLAIVVAAGANWVDPKVWQAGAIAGGAAVLSAVKTWVVTKKKV